MSKWKTTHQPCPDTVNCGSSNGYSEDLIGGGYCFVCEEQFSNGQKYKGTFNVPGISKEEAANLDDLILEGSYESIPDRKLSKEVCEFFDIKTTSDRYIFGYKDKETGKSLVAQKTRFKDQKIYPWKGDTKAAGLFGIDKYSGGKRITIVEGEFDVPAYKLLMGDYPVCSVKNGAQGGVKDVRDNLEKFKNFEQVYVCMDNDEPGQTAAIKIAELFPIGKAKVVNLRHHKDAGEYLKAGHYQEFKKCWWDAEEFTPAGIEPASKGGFDSLFDDIDNLQIFPYPYDTLNETAFGIRKGEMVTVVAGSGVGKSAFIGETAYKLLMETDKKIGCIFLEESVKKTKLKFMSLFLNKPLHLTLLGRIASKFKFLENVMTKLFKDESSWEFNADTKEELRKAYGEVVEKKAHDGANQLWLFNHFGSNDIDSIVNKIDAMVTGLGCEFIFLDHVSIVVSDQQNSDERKALDELSTKLRTLVEHRNFSLIIVSHLRRPGGKPHEEGGETSLADIRGTAGIGQLSDVVIGLERNGQHDNPYIRNVTWMRVLKNRFCGMTGLTSCAHYDIETGRLLEVDP